MHMETTPTDYFWLLIFVEALIILSRYFRPATAAAATFVASLFVFII